MLFNSSTLTLTILSIVVLFSGQAMALADNPVDACNGSNHYGQGHDCAFKTSDGSKAEGLCQFQNNVLVCVPN